MSCCVTESKQKSSLPSHVLTIILGVLLASFIYCGAPRDAKDAGADAAGGRASDIHIQKVSGGLLDIYNGTGYYDFGNVVNATYPGSPGPEIEFRIENPGAGTLMLKGGPGYISLTGSNPGEFQITQQVSQSTVAAGADASSGAPFKIRFYPSSNGLKSATVQVRSNAQGKSLYSFTIRGNATATVAPGINLQRNEIPAKNISTGDIVSFANTLVSGSSPEISFSIQSTGLADLTLSSSPFVTLAGADSSHFQIVAQPASGTIAAGTSQAFSVKFVPGSIGIKNANLQIVSNDANTPTYTINIQGLGYVMSPEINIAQTTTSISSGGTFTFSTTRPGAWQDAVFTVRNQGGAMLNLTGTPKIALSGADAGLFSVISQPSSQVTPFAETTFTIRFAPTAVGSRNAVLSVPSNDSDESLYTINLSASAAAATGPCISVTSDSVAANFAVSPNFYGTGITGFYTDMFSTTVGPANPTMIFFANQDFSNVNPILASLYSQPGVYDPYFDTKGGFGETNLTFMFPYGTSSAEFLNYNGSTGFLPAVNPEVTQNLFFDYTTPYSMAASSLDYSIVRGCEPRLLEDANFIPASGGTSTNGLNKVWSNRKKINIKLIFIQGTYPTYTVSGIQTAVDRMKAIFAQNSVMIDTQVTATSVNASEFQSIADISDQTGVFYGSLSKLMIQNPGSAQSTQALNIYIASEETEVGGTLSLSPGIPGVPGITGQLKAGIIVFIEPHRSSGAAASNLISADLQYLGNTMAHEAAHYLGLFNTNESGGYDASASVLNRLWGGDGKDALIETPYCASSNDVAPADGQVSITECSGAGFSNSGASNLMFWVSDGVTAQTQLTGEQGWVLRGSPLVY